jgi:quercetin dioxygenase-like cupin family protein
MTNVIELPHEIGMGKDREVRTLLADPWRKLVLICLRQSALLADHSARVPITIQTVLGKGTLRVGDRVFALSPGILVPVDAHVEHNVQAEPAVALLVTFFRQAGDAAIETTAKFDE